MTISLERYVAITSGVIGDQVVAMRQLVGLRFTTDPRLPVDTVLVVDQDGAAEYFGADSDEADFAAQYFSYISPAPASRPRALRFAPWANVARAPRIYGAGAAYSVSAFSGISDGAIALTIGAHTEEVVGISLTGIIALADVASALQSAIRAVVAGSTQWTGATVVYNATAQAFNLVGGEAGDAVVSVGVASTGTDLAPLIGWNSGNTILSPGSAAKTPTEAMQAAHDVTDNFGSFSFDGDQLVDAALIKAVAQYNASLNVKFMMLHGVPRETASSLFTALADVASIGLVLNGTPGQYKEAIPAAIQAATDYNRRNATVNYMYRQVAGMTADVSSNDDANLFDAIKVNYYGQTASAGQNLAFFQRGFLLGSATSPQDMNVHSNEQWLKSYLQSLLLSQQISIGKLPANATGRGMVLGQVNAAAQRGKLNGTISVGKTLTVTQQIAVTDLTGDPTAWREVQTNGYWADVEIVPETGPSGVTEYVALYTLAYAKNDVVRMIRGSHNMI